VNPRFSLSYCISESHSSYLNRFYQQESDSRSILRAEDRPPLNLIVHLKGLEGGPGRDVGGAARISRLTRSLLEHLVDSSIPPTKQQEWCMEEFHTLIYFRGRDLFAPSCIGSTWRPFMKRLPSYVGRPWSCKYEKCIT
jgi:hypothetical protein